MNKKPPFDPYEKALALHRKGAFKEAILAYQSLLGLDPSRDARLFDLMGTASLQSGDFVSGERYLAKALVMQPNQAPIWGNHAVALSRLGRYAEALESRRRYVSLAPQDAHGHIELGGICQSLGQVAEAVTHYDVALRLAPETPEAWYNRGVALQSLEQIKEAIQSYRKAIAYKPGYVEAHNNLGVLLQRLGDLDGAVEAFDLAIRLKPNHVHAVHNRGFALQVMGKTAEALAGYDAALAIDPNYIEAHCNKANVLQLEWRLDEALGHYEKALALNPEHADANLWRSFIFLRRGQYAEGWRAYEFRWARPQAEQSQFMQPPFSKTQWRGERGLAGKTLLIYPEQGLGDTLQFFRYALQADAAGAKVIVLAPVSLARLMRNLPGRHITVIQEGDTLPHFDLCCPAMSLPFAFRTTLDDLPGPFPYLVPDPQDVARWAARMGPASQLRVGLVWAGNPRKYDPSISAIDRQRSLSLDQLAPLFDVQGVQFFSLQKDAGDGDIVAQLREGPWRDQVIDWTDDFHDFADTAALIANLDLVVSVDTSVLHLAGAMGKPVWMLDRLNHCWRWLEGRSKSPWYPSLRIFRQRVLGEWDEPVANMTTELIRRLGIKYLQQGELALGESTLSIALGRDSSHAWTWVNRAVALNGLGRAAEALDCFNAALSRDAGLGAARLQRAHVLRKLGQLDAALADYEAVLAESGVRYWEAFYCRGLCLSGLGRIQEALVVYQTMVEQDPGHVNAWLNQGISLVAVGRPAEAVVCYERLVALKPQDSETHRQLATVLHTLGRFEAAMIQYQRALTLDPGNIEAEWNCALLTLAQGRYEEGWVDHNDCRKRQIAKARRVFTEPEWTRDFSIAGRTLLIQGEQGFGDILQFARYAPLAEQAGAKVIFSVPKALIRLIQTVSPSITVIEYAESPPSYDRYCWVMTLPFVFGTTLKNIPANVPYFHPDAKAVKAWARRLAATKSLKVGIVWAGNPRKDQPGAHAIDRERSLELAQLAPILGIKGVRFYSLQKDADDGSILAQLHEGPWKARVTDWTDDLHDFSDTAALIQNLDLVVSVDTSVLHLAGGLGKPVWLLDRFNNCWRWLQGRLDSPWYPSLRIFRQTHIGHWADPVEDLAQALKDWVRSRRG